MQTLWLCVFLVSGAWAQEVESPVHTRGQEWSFGFAAGGLSGAGGMAARYWGERWGGQLSLLPIYIAKIHESSFTLGSSIQLLRRLHRESPRSHELGGYVHTQFYEYFALSCLLHRSWDPQAEVWDDYGTESWDGFVSLGSGLGVETFWRNWRLATGVGLALYTFDWAQENGMDFVIAPTVDLTLSYGF